MIRIFIHLGVKTVKIMSLFNISTFDPPNISLHVDMGWAVVDALLSNPLKLSQLSPAIRVLGVKN